MILSTCYWTAHAPDWNALNVSEKINVGGRRQAVHEERLVHINFTFPSSKYQSNEL